MEKTYYKILDNDLYLQILNIKLKEELNEYLESGEVKELADLIEVVYIILKAKGINLKELNKVRLSKRKEKSGFENIKLEK
ncbi:nucleoside triphosphate pyrophosphohydrolase [Thermohalobacter berrensis]|uniref:nucleoside triphosphate pyrophosphohydrolase n=1 Tax=Thermohalobacter berrensis TaxID=99594 RepID=UPI000E744344|nr:nucleoside triphosphate pyrophosphohydrolase [Thermohalobacter berrensis]